MHPVTNVSSRESVIASVLYLPFEPTCKVDLLMNKQTRCCPDIRSIRRSTAANESARFCGGSARRERVVASGTTPDNI
jgi:hypothetical protein